MDRLKLSLGACILTIILISQLLTTGVARAAPLTCGSWSIVPSPNPGSLANFLNGVKVVSASNVWAVGYYTNSSGLSQTLIEQWNGTAWSVVPSPNVGSSDNFLYSVAAAPGSSTIWAVGDYVNSSNHLQTLIEQWNGTAWSVVPSPNVGLSTNVLFSVTAASTSTAVAVGGYINKFNHYQTLIERWNGTKWKVMSSPNVGSNDNQLKGVAIVSLGNFWAVGYYYNSSNSQQTLTEQWNGTAWNVVPSPSVGSLDNQLNAVAAVPGSSTAWAVGIYANNGSHAQTLIEQWNGTAWSVVPSPNLGTSDNFLSSVTTTSTSTAVAVGSYTNSSNQDRTLIESWNGTSWGASPGPNVGSNGNEFSSVAAVPGSNWAVGSYNTNSGTIQTLTAHC